ncbi:MAG: ABC transporter permease [Cyclobacteriaceae bacterium]|nr:ABC transporter permease [Cyclobacteriaceae bacterium]
MFDIDKWQEIFYTIRRNKLRTFLTMFGVFWGIFMLMVLIGSGQGLQNGVLLEFRSWATNSGFIWGGRTTLPFEGMQPGRMVRFNNGDIEALSQIRGIAHLAPRANLGGWGGGNQISRNNKSGSFTIQGEVPEFQFVQNVDVHNGRYIHHIDLGEKKKVAVIGENVYNILFDAGEDPIGEYIKINNVNFKVIGVFKSFRKGDLGERDTQSVIIPFSTFQIIFNYGNRVGWFAFTVKPEVLVSDVQSQMETVLKKRHKIHPDDRMALSMNNLQKEFGQIMSLFTGIRIFIWIVGIGTLLAGVVGVSNIMLIIVKDRTKEIGIRKALGATPASVVGLIIQESVFLTLIAGYFGIIAGFVLLEAISMAMLRFNLDTGMFKNPEIRFETAVLALMVLIVAGILAGWIPAKKAANIQPIEALRTE